MSYTNRYKDDTILKLIINDIGSKEQQKVLLEKLQDYHFYELHFKHIKMLPSTIILKMYKIKDQLSLQVDDKKLRFYLRDLGFNIHQKEYVHQRQNEIQNIHYLALGGSAGSLKKFIEILSALPPSNISIFIIMHQRSDVKSSLATILQNKTQHYRVIEATNDTKVTPSTIYVAPPDKHLIVSNGCISLSYDPPQHFSRPSISTTFHSLSQEYKEQLLVILVCGYGADGSDSLKTIRKNGGKVIIEQLYECEATPMLENAIQTKEFDYILSISDINKLLKEKLIQELSLATHLEDFLKKINQKYGYDYTHYSKEHIIRRVEHFYTSLGFKNFFDFEEKILHNKKLFKDMTLDISINVTTLFRNPEMYKVLRKYIQKHFQDKHSLKIWCAGCSSGEEPYSVAIMLKELGVLEKSLIYATDINDVILEQAKNALYSKKNFELFQEHHKDSGSTSKLENYFTSYKDFMMINEDIRKNILFFRHNLVTDGVLNEFQLIFCRNVIIYFDTHLKKKVFDLFDNSLQEDGVLILGESEAYDDRKNFITLNKDNKLYGKSKNSTC